MAAYNKFNVFVYHLGKGYHDLTNGNHDCKVYLTNNAPDANADVWKADLAGITEESNYAPTTANQDWTQTANITELTGEDITFTADGGNFGPFRYVVLYNDNATDGNNVDALIAWWDYGSSINCNNGESFTWDVPANGLIANIT